MQNTRFGCLTASGLITVLVTIVIIAGVGVARGGVMFNPGPLNAQSGAQAIGGARSHAEIGGECRTCHAPFWSSDRMADRCLACHNSLTANPQNFHAVMLAQSQEFSCLRCHTDHRGENAELTILDMQRFPHNDTASFSLAAHQQMADGSTFACTDCHGAELGIFEQTTCKVCHVDIDPEYMAAHSGTFGENCLACHDGVDTYGAGFDHNQTDFPLQGEHAEGDCAACHRGARALADLQLTPSTCYDCHAFEDAHDGQFGQNCAACHTPQNWERVTFDHNQTGFPLEGEHNEVACQSCHQGGQFEDTPETCYGCHAADDEHNGELGTNCAACHTPQDWEQVTFDHSQSDFPLQGKHQNVACESCHTGDTFTGTSSECVACHAADDAHEGRFGTVCAQCHTPDDWVDATFDHALANFQLTGAHVNVACADCHVGNAFAGTPMECAACHAEPVYHQGLFPSNCDECHTTSAWSPAPYNRAHRFPLNHGERGVSQCSVCHPNTLTAYTCYGCHEHNRGNIENEHREEGISNFQDCTRCHPTGREEEGEHEGDDD
jgi:hypothetical protein